MEIRHNDDGTRDGLVGGTWVRLARVPEPAERPATVDPVSPETALYGQKAFENTMSGLVVDGDEITSEEITRSHKIVAAASRLAREDDRRAYLTAKEQNDARTAFALFLLVPAHTRRALGWPTTEKAFQDSWGLPTGWCRMTKAQAKFKREYLTNGVILDRQREGLTEVMDALKEKCLSGEASAAHFKQYLVLAQQLLSSDEAVESDDRSRPVSRTAEQEAEQWSPRFLATIGARRLVEYLGGGSLAKQRVHECVEQMVLSALKGEAVHAGQQKALREATVRTSSTDYVTPEFDGEDAVIVSEV